MDEKLAKYIPQIEPWINGREMYHLEEVIRSTYITEGAKTEEFLDGIKKITGANHAIAMSNGTVALVAALICAGVKSGDEVIVPDLTFIASSNAVILVGGIPVFCDVSLETGCMDVECCKSLINERTKAIIPVHLYGQAVEMDALLAIVSGKNISIVEDAAESLGVIYKGKHTGLIGDFGVFSFFANKVVTCGEGGVVLTNTPENLASLFRVKNHGRDRKGIFIHDQIGYNFCFTDLQAAVGVAQLEKFDDTISAKSRNFHLYARFLSDCKEVKLITPPDHVESNYWFNNILVKDPAALGEYLHAKGIGTRRFFYPLHLQPCYAHMPTNFCPNSLELYQRGLSLPSGVLLDETQIEYVCQQIKQFFVTAH